MCSIDQGHLQQRAAPAAVDPRHRRPVKRGHAALDAARIKSILSKHKAMADGVAESQAEIAGWLCTAEAADVEHYGRDIERQGAAGLGRRPAAASREDPKRQGPNGAGDGGGRSQTRGGARPQGRQKKADGSRPTSEMPKPMGKLGHGP